MARPRPTTEAQWTQEGIEAIVDLVSDKLVVPWPEVESRITHGPWKDFHPVQPLPLNGARRALRAEDPPRVIEETSDHAHHPVTTLRVPFNGDKRNIERLRGAQRKLFRKYLSWTGNQDLCGRHAEGIVLESLQAAQTSGGLWVPPQAVGNIEAVEGKPIEPGPLDALAWILDPNTVTRKSALLVEVKNVRPWLYPWAPEVWELLVKTAGVADQLDTLALLAAPHVAWPTMQMARDVGFAVVRYDSQLFSPAIDEEAFTQVVEAFGLTISQHLGPLPQVRTFLNGFLRAGPAGSVFEANTDWSDQQANRLALLAPIILEHRDLAGNLNGAVRRQRYMDFKDRLEDVAGWDLVGGY
jgi:hypothetical protein